MGETQLKGLEFLSRAHSEFNGKQRTVGGLFPLPRVLKGPARRERFVDLRFNAKKTRHLPNWFTPQPLAVFSPLSKRFAWWHQQRSSLPVNLATLGIPSCVTSASTFRPMEFQRMLQRSRPRTRAGPIGETGEVLGGGTTTRSPA